MSELDKFFPRNEDGSIPGSETPSPEKSKKKKVSPKVYGQRGEKWTKDYLEKLAGFVLEKRSDAPIDLPNGSTLYPGKNQLDHSGYILPHGASWAIHAELEVKTFQDDFTISQISAEQVKKLTEAANGRCLTMLCLVAREGLDIVKMWWIPWPMQDLDGVYAPRLTMLTPKGYVTVKTFAWVMGELRKRIKGGFKAKSIRVQDRDLLVDFAVSKVKNKWTLSKTHWLHSFIFTRAEQLDMFGNVD